MKTILNLQIARILRVRKILDDKTIKKQLGLLDNTTLRLDKELLKQNLINESYFAMIGSELFGLKYMDIDTIGYDERVVREVTNTFVTKHGLIPLGKEEDKTGTLYYNVAIYDPFNSQTLILSRAIFSDNCKIYVTEKNKIEKIQGIVFSKAHVADAISEYVDPDSKKNANEATESQLDAEDRKSVV